MRGLWKLAWTDFKLYLREPSAAFFTMAFPVMMLFLFGSLNGGNKPLKAFGGFGMVDILVPSYTGIIIATTGLLSLSISMAAQREKGILRRLKATPLRPQAVLGAHVIMLFVMTSLGMAIMIAAAKTVFGLRFPGHFLSVLAAFVLSTLCFFALGFVMAGLASTARGAQALGMVVFYPMIFLSGATIPKEAFPQSVWPYMQILPLTHVVSLMRGMWFGGAWGAHVKEVVILMALLVLGVVVSAKTFRWE